MTIKKLKTLDIAHAAAMKLIRDGGRGTTRHENLAFDIAMEREVVQRTMSDLPIPIPCKKKYKVQQRFPHKGMYVGRTGRRNGRHNKGLNYKW